jgi:hypothetical protein
MVDTNKCQRASQLLGLCRFLSPVCSPLCYHLQTIDVLVEEANVVPLDVTTFTTLKNCLYAAPILKLPDFTRQFCIETDASNCGVSVVLLQDGHPLAFLSWALGPRNQGLSVYEKEYMAILIAVDQWHSYLQLGEFIIFHGSKEPHPLRWLAITHRLATKGFHKTLGAPIPYSVQA